MPQTVPIKVKHVEMREHIELDIGTKMDSRELALFLIALRQIHPERHFYVDRINNRIISKPRRDRDVVEG